MTQQVTGAVLIAMESRESACQRFFPVASKSCVQSGGNYYESREDK